MAPDSRIARFRRGFRDSGAAFAVSVTLPIFYNSPSNLFRKEQKQRVVHAGALPARRGTGHATRTLFFVR
jgi:hypothetical protein